MQFMQEEDRKSAAPLTATHAVSVNEKFQTAQDVIVNLEERWSESFIKKDPSLTEFLPQMLQEFRDRFPQYTMFEDMYSDMVQMSNDQSERIKMRQLLINATIQRELDPDWIINILGKFDPFFVNIVRVYPDGTVKTKDKQKYCIWDGQHTTFTLLCIALFGFGLSWEEAMELEIPTAVYPNTNIAKLRQRFIGVHDNTMTKPLDKIDLYMQYVWAVRNNGDTDPWSMRFEQIQSAMEEFNCFFTHDKFGDTDMPGAISRPSEVFPTGRDVNKWKSSVLRQVFQYHTLSNPDAPVEPLEIDNMAHIFRACDQQGIVVDDEYVQAVVKYLGVVTNNTWAKGYNQTRNRKHKMIMDAYQSWLKRQHYRIRENYNTRCNQTEVAPTWLCQAMGAAGFPFELPVFIGKYAYEFNAKELGV
jgi:hypothetical protein